MRINLMTACGTLLLIAGCSSGGGGGDDGGVDTGDAVSLDTASAEELEVAQQTDQALDYSFSAAFSSIGSATGGTASVHLPGLAQPAATETLTVTDVAVDTNADGSNDALVNGSGTAEITGDENAGSLTMSLVLNLRYTADTEFTDGSDTVTVGTGSAVGTDMYLSVEGSNSNNTAEIDYTFTLDDYTVTWQSGSDSGTTVLSGSYRLRASNLSVAADEDALSMDMQGTTEIDLSGSVVVNGTSHSVAYSGDGSFSITDTGISIETTAYISIDGTVYGPFSEEDLIDQPATTN